MKKLIWNDWFHRALAMTACLMVFGISIGSIIGGIIGIVAFEIFFRWIQSRQ